MIKLEDLTQVKMDSRTLKIGCLNPDKEIFFLKFISLGELPPKIYGYIVSHSVQECVNLIDEIKGAKDLRQNKPDLWEMLKDTVFSP